MTGQRDRLGADFTGDDEATLSMLLSGPVPGPAAITWSGASATGLPPDAWPVAVKVRGEPTEPFRAVTVPAPSKGRARVEKTLAYLQAEVEILEEDGEADQVHPAVVKHLKALPEDHPARLLVAKAKRMLRPKKPWQPSPEPPICWYDPENGDDGMPVRRDPDAWPEPDVPLTRPYVGREGAR
jgi:hypothetical protein